MKYQLFLILSVYSGVLFAQDIFYKTQIELWNGTIIEASHIEIVNEGLPTCHLLADGSQQIAIKMVASFQMTDSFYLVKEMGDFGLTILKRTINGKIQIYEFSRTELDPFAISNGKNKVNYTHYLYNKELKSLNGENLKSDLKEYPEYVTRIKKNERKTIVRMVTITSGLCLTGIGIGQMMEPDASGVQRLKFSLNPSFIAGMALIIAPILRSKRSKDSLEQIIVDFNQNS